MYKGSEAIAIAIVALALASGSIGYGVCLLVNQIGSGAPFLGIGGVLLSASGVLFARNKIQKT